MSSLEAVVFVWMYIAVTAAMGVGAGPGGAINDKRWHLLLEHGVT